jgi:dihydroorotase
MKLSDDGKTLVIRLPDNFHFHFRQGAMLPFLVLICLQYGWRARLVAEPNTKPEKTEAYLVIEYGDEIMNAAKDKPHSKHLKVIPALQITEKTTKEMVYEFKRRGGRVAKVYPFKVTNNSENGVLDYLNIYPALAACEELGIIVQFHAQHPGFDVEGWYKEIKFIDLILDPIRKNFPNLQFTIEHIHTKYGVEWVKKQPVGLVAAGVTIQHMTNTIDDCIGYSERSNGKICVHEGFKPHAQLREDRDAIRQAVFDGDPHFFYAGDDAWHPRSMKECAEGACGAANTLATLPLLVKIFIENNVLHRLEPFLSEIGAKFYGFELNEDTLTLTKETWVIPDFIPVPGLDDVVVPWRAREKMEWKVVV